MVAKMDDHSEPSTICHRECCILIPAKSQRCSSCQKYRASLRSQLSSLGKAKLDTRTDPYSRTNFKSLTRKELTARAKHLSAVQARTARKLALFQTRLSEAVKTSGIAVDGNMHSDLASIIELHHSEVTAQHAPGSFARVFWEQQRKAAQLKDSRGMRWHPMMIKWAIYLHYRSGGAYDTLRASGVLALPLQRTLRDFTHHCNAQTGFSPEVDEQLKAQSDLHGAEHWQRYVILLLDEMHIREDLVYNKNDGSLVGFVDLGDVNNHLQKFECLIDSNQAQVTTQLLAKSMSVIMVRGLFTKLRFPYAQFSCVNLTGEQISPLFWEAVYRAERCELKVVGATFDGASPNRRFLQLQDPRPKPDGQILHKVNNPYAGPETREIFFISDPLHLVKTVRNCFSSSARRLWVRRTIC